MLQGPPSTDLKDVPMEIMIYILTLAIEGAMGHSDMRWGPCTLSLVSKDWKNIVMNGNFPEIWSFISIDLTYERLRREARAATILNEHITRSKISPLTIRFISDTPSLNSEEILDKLITHSRRWRSVYFKLPGPHHLRLNRIPLGGVPLLQKFHYGGGFSYFFAKCEEAPLLFDVAIRGSVSATTRFPWSQITHFEANFSCEEDVALLRQMQGLVECTLHTNCYALPVRHSPQVDLDSILPLPRLRKLHWPHNPEAKVLNLLVLPALEELFLDASHQFPSFASLISRSSCSLTTLDITGLSSESDAIVDILGQMPKMFTLRLAFLSLGGALASLLIRRLTVSGSGDIYLPALRHLSIEGPTRVIKPLVIPISFANMIRSRRTGALTAKTIIQSLSITASYDSSLSQPHLPSEVVIGMESLREDGMDITVSWCMDRNDRYSTYTRYPDW